MLVVVIGLALATGFIRWQPAWPDIAWLFLLNNLLITSLAEGALLRVFFTRYADPSLGWLCLGSSGSHSTASTYTQSCSLPGKPALYGTGVCCQCFLWLDLSEIKVFRNGRAGSMVAE